MGISSIGSKALRTYESTALQDGKIDKAEAAKLGKLAKSDKALAKQLLYEDAFEDTNARKAFAKAAGISTKGAAKNPIAGQTVGSATITRTLGDEKGYENELEAVGAARQSGVANAGVVQRGDRWYPVELSKEQPGALAGNGDLSQGLGLTKYDQATVDDLRSQLKTARANGDADQAIDLQKQLAAAIYGLPKDSFEVIGRTESRVETRLDGPIPKGINIQNGLYAAGGGTLGTHGPAKGTGEGFDPAKGTSITIDAGELEGRTRTKDSIVDGKPEHKTWFEQPSMEAAAGVLEHEATHLEDFDEAKKFINQWGADKFSAGDADGAFATHMRKLLKEKKVDPATAERVIHAAQSLNNETELHAHLATAVDSIRNGAPDVATQQLVDYAKALKGAPPLPHAKDAMLEEATKAYKAMTKDQQKQFKAAIKAANDEVGKDSPLWGYNPDKFKPAKK